MPEPAAPSRLSPEEADRVRRRLRHLARLMDGAVRIPGTSIRLGLDSLIGLLPGGGDLATGLVAAYVVYEARRLGASKGTLARMVANVGVDVLVGAIPVLGDVFDVAFKANERNLRLLGIEAAPTGARKDR